MEKYFKEQEEQLDRLMEIITADDPNSLIGCLTFYDVIIFTCQCMWHLKDWILNDMKFGSKDIERLKKDIHAKKCLTICGDIANASKHFRLTKPKTEFSSIEEAGCHIDTKLGIYHERYSIVSSNTNDPYHGMEIRVFLKECRSTWNLIINEHYLSRIEL